MVWEALPEKATLFTVAQKFRVKRSGVFQVGDINFQKPIGIKMFSTVIKKRREEGHPSHMEEGIP